MRADIEYLRERTKKIDKRMDRIVSLLESDEDTFEQLYKEIGSLIHSLETATGCARNMALKTGHIHAMDNLRETATDAQGVTCGYTKEGEFHLHLPRLLPHKKAGPPRHIRTLADFAMERYFSNNPKIEMESPYTIAFVHNYDKKKPRKAWRDHDNQEVSAVINCFATHVIKGDAAYLLDHYYHSEEAEEDSTDVWVMPSKGFLNWKTRVGGRWAHA